MSRQAVYRPFGCFRFLLALLVLCQHELHLLPIANRVYFYHLELGIIAVAIFFVVSGFIVAEANDVFYRRRPWQFISNRLLRLIPPYLAALLMTIAVHYVLFSQGRLVPWDAPLVGSPLQWRVLLSGLLDVVPFFRPSYVSHQEFEFIPFAWTLRVEFAFYLYVFGVFLLLSFETLTERARRMVAVAGFGTAYLLFFAFLLSNSRLPQQMADIPFFLFGISTFRSWRYPGRGSRVHVWFAAVCMLAAFPLWRQKGSPVLVYQLPILFLLVAMFVNLKGMDISERWQSLDRWLGNLSYPLYLNHFVVLLLLSTIFSGRLGWDLYILGAVFSIILAALMYWIVETPLRHLRDGIRGAALNGSPLPTKDRFRTVHPDEC